MLATRMRMGGNGLGPQSFTLVDNISHVAVNNDTWTRTFDLGVAHARRKIITVVTGHDSAGSINVTAISQTIAGVSATLVGTLDANSDGSDDTFAAIFIADVPTGTTGSIVTSLTYAGTWDDYGMAVFRVTGMRSSTPANTYASFASVDVPTNGFFVAGGATNSGSLGTFTGTGAVSVHKYDRTSSIGYSTTAGTAVAFTMSNASSRFGASWSFT